jgi:hypothetical protein
MAPFTPFFAEYLYQNLRKLLPLHGNTDPAVPVDAPGKAASVHYLMLPEVDTARLNPRAEARFKTLQQAVTLARVARERRHIRNNLPLKDVLVVAANDDDVEALEYLKGYFTSEINAWKVTLSTEWEKLCALKVQPNWKDLGKRLGKQMKDVAAAINALSHQQVGHHCSHAPLSFDHSPHCVAFCVPAGGGLHEHGGHDGVRLRTHQGGTLLHPFTPPCVTEKPFNLLNPYPVLFNPPRSLRQDVVVRRAFNGDEKRYEAAVSDDGALMVAIDTTCDDEVRPLTHAHHTHTTYTHAVL